MSTSSTISALQTDGTIKSIYCHSDGNIEHNGYMLANYYNSQQLVDWLIELGDLSSLEENISPDELYHHDFEDPQDNVTVAYHRDRGEELNITIYQSLKEYKRAGEEADYNYFWDGNKWNLFGGSRFSKIVAPKK